MQNNICIRVCIRCEAEGTSSRLWFMDWVECIFLLATWWSTWRLSTDVPMWHGACVPPHINLVTAGYQQRLPTSVCVCMYVCACVYVQTAACMFVSGVSAALDEWGQRTFTCGLCWRNNNHLAIDRHDNSKVPKRLRGVPGEGERWREWERIYKMRITGPDKIVESFISLPVSPITN